MRLVPFTDDLLPAVRPWFHNGEVRRRLGGPEWPDRALAVAAEPPGEVYRGRVVLRVHTWAGLDDDGTLVAYLGGDVYDRWATAGDGPSMGFAYVVDPARWNQGHGRTALGMLLIAPEVADVRVFAAGIEPDNLASVHCATAAGFAADDPVPDYEGIVHYLFRRGMITS